MSGPGYFANLRNDRQYIQEETGRSVAPGLWRMDANPYINLNKCQPMNGPINSSKNTSDVFSRQVDVASILDGRSKPSTLANYGSLPDTLDMFQLTDLPECEWYRDTQYSRYDTPARDIRGMATPDMRLDYPLFDPQCQIFENFSQNTRQQARDNFRATWQVGIDSNSDNYPSDRLGRTMSRDNEYDRAYYGANTR